MKRLEDEKSLLHNKEKNRIKYTKVGHQWNKNQKTQIPKMKPSPRCFPNIAKDVWHDSLLNSTPEGIMYCCRPIYKDYIRYKTKTQVRLVCELSFIYIYRAGNTERPWFEDVRRRTGVRGGVYCGMLESAQNRLFRWPREYRCWRC